MSKFKLQSKIRNQMSQSILHIKPLGFPWETQDPFIFCVYHLDHFPAGNGQMGVRPEDKAGHSIGNDFQKRGGFRMYHGSEIPGFPYHPHRGFETITINKQGVVDHTDSLGAAGRFMEGDVQWMTAGKGVQHSEMFPLLNDDEPNTLEIFQIWLNLPRASKMVEPHFKMLWKEKVPVLTLTDEAGNQTFIDVVAGKMHDTVGPEPTPDSWAADPANAVGVFTIKMQPHAQWTLPATAADAHRTLYFYDGQNLQVDGQPVQPGHLVQLKADTSIDIHNGATEGYLLILEGKPINEPVVSYGPFVMNSEEEIRQAYADFRKTQFGGWPWPQTEQVHPQERGRFALHGDGREEVLS